jgi:Uma2 family endonuclease
MASVGQLSVDEYLTNQSHLAFEYVDGTLIEKSMSTWMHSALQAWISVLIMRQYPQYRAGGEVHARFVPPSFVFPMSPLNFGRLRSRKATPNSHPRFVWRFFLQKTGWDLPLQNASAITIGVFSCAG